MGSCLFAAERLLGCNMFRLLFSPLGQTSEAACTLETGSQMPQFFLVAFYFILQHIANNHVCWDAMFSAVKQGRPWVLLQEDCSMFSRQLSPDWHFFNPSASYLSPELLSLLLFLLQLAHFWTWISNYILNFSNYWKKENHFSFQIHHSYHSSLSLSWLSLYLTFLYCTKLSPTVHTKFMLTQIFPVCSTSCC